MPRQPIGAGAPAIVAPGRSTLTYSQLRRQAADVVAALNAAGIGRHDRVALLLPEGPDLAVAILAIAAGTSIAPLNPAATTGELEFVLGALKVHALVVAAQIDSPVMDLAAERGIAVFELSPMADAEAGRFTLAGPHRSRPARGGWAEPGDIAVLLHTSGTTERQRLVPLTHTNLFASALAVSEVLGLTATDRCLNLMRMFHSSFIGNLLASLTAGGSVVCAPGIQASRFFAWIEECCPTWSMATPTTYRAILDRASAHRDVITGCPLRFVRSGAAPLSVEVEAELEAVFGVPVIQGYGMTEASPVLTTTPLPPRPRKPGSVGVAVGATVAILGEDGRLLPSDAEGEVVARGPNLMHGYVADEVATRQAFTPDGWFRTGDLGYLDADGYLFLTGRLKELINRGGEKVSPGEVEAALLEHPAVAEAVAFALPDLRLGEEVAAAVVLLDGCAATDQELRAFASERLTYQKLPRRILFVPELPTGPTGKPLRIGLAQTLGLAPPPLPELTPEDGFVPPRTPLEGLVAGIWQEVLGLGQVGAEDDFLALGGDSVLAAQVVARLREALGVAIPMVTFFQTPTVAAVAAAVARCGLKQVGTSEAVHLLAETEASCPLVPRSLPTNGSR